MNAAKSISPGGRDAAEPATPGIDTPQVRARRGPAALALRRIEILDAAGKVIAERGLSETTIERVAREAAVSPGTIINYFPTKDALLKAVLEAVAQEFETARRSIFETTPDNPVATLGALIDMMFAPEISSPRKVAIWYAFWGEPTSRQLYLQRVGALDQRFEADLLAAFEAIISGGAYHELDADAACRGFAGLLDWSWQEILAVGNQIDRTRGRERARNYLRNLFPRHFPPDMPPPSNDRKLARTARRKLRE